LNPFEDQADPFADFDEDLPTEDLFEAHDRDDSNASESRAHDPDAPLTADNETEDDVIR